MLGALILALFASSALAVEVCYDPCGCFDDNPPFDDRPLPESPEVQNIIWLLYTQSNRNVGVNIHWDDIPPEYDSGRETKFLIHGFNDSPGQRDSMIDIKNAFLDAGYDFNIITVDWSQGASGVDYPQAASNTRVVGYCSGHLANVLTNAASVHCIGHSLGGHTCGYMGQSMSGNIGRISGLDPAGPAFEALDEQVRLDPSDARLVDAMHTNSQGDAGYSGIEMPVGHIDFYPHNGARQPPCDNNLCDHGVCRDYYVASIAESSCTFLSYPCDNYADAGLAECGTCNQGVNCQSMGFHADTYPGRGTFYLEVNGNYPYCQN